MALNAFLQMKDVQNNDVIIGTQHITQVRPNFYNPDNDVTISFSEGNSISVKCKIDDFMKMLHGQHIG